MISRSAAIDPMNVVPQYAEGDRIVMNRLRKYPHEPSNVPCVRSEREKYTFQIPQNTLCSLVLFFSWYFLLPRLPVKHGDPRRGQISNSFLIWETLMSLSFVPEKKPRPLEEQKFESGGQW